MTERTPPGRLRDDPTSGVGSLLRQLPPPSAPGPNDEARAFARLETALAASPRKSRARWWLAGGLAAAAALALILVLRAGGDPASSGGETVVLASSEPEPPVGRPLPATAQVRLRPGGVVLVARPSGRLVLEGQAEGRASFGAQVVVSAPTRFAAEQIGAQPLVVGDSDTWQLRVERGVAVGVVGGPRPTVTVVEGRAVLQVGAEAHVLEGPATWPVGDAPTALSARQRALLRLEAGAARPPSGAGSVVVDGVELGEGPLYLAVRGKVAAGQGAPEGAGVAAEARGAETATDEASTGARPHAATQVAAADNSNGTSGAKAAEGTKSGALGAEAAEANGARSTGAEASDATAARSTGAPGVEVAEANARSQGKTGSEVVVGNTKRSPGVEAPQRAGPRSAITGAAAAASPGARPTNANADARGHAAVATSPEISTAVPSSSAERRLERATALAASGKARDAAAELEAVADSDDAAARVALYQLGVLRLRTLADPKGAAEAFRSSLRRFPSDPLAEDVQVSLVEALLAATAFTDAEAEATRFLERYPRSGQAPHLRLVRANIRREWGDCRAAVTDYLALEAGQGAPAADALFFHALCARRDGDPGASTKLLGELRARFPNSPRLEDARRLEHP